MLTQRQVVAREARDEIHEIVEQMLLDELHDAGRRRCAGDVVGALAERGTASATATAHSDRARKAWSFSASPIPTMLWGDSSSAASASQTGALGDAARQQHEGALVEHERAVDAGFLDGGQGRLREGRVGGEDRGAQVEANAPPAQRLDQRRLGGSPSVRSSRRSGK